MKRSFIAAPLLVCTFWAFGRLAEGGEARSPKETKELQVKTVTLDPSTQTPVVILEVIQDKTFLPIWIGNAEAASIAMELEHLAIPRPNTHDLIRNILGDLGASLHHITITEIKDNTYFAKLTLEVKGKEVNVDSRPSDAIAVALRMKAPIYASNEVLAKAKKAPDAPQVGELRRTLGIQVQELNANLANLLSSSIERGLLVSDVLSNSIASAAGLQRGDIIFKVNDKGVQNIAQMESLLKTARSTGIRVEVMRKGKPLSLLMKLPS